MDTTQSKTQATPAQGTFDPQQMFQKAMTDAQARAQAWAEQYAAFEQMFVARAQGAIQTWAQLAQDAIAYSAQLSAEARKLGLDAVRKAAA